VSHNFSNVMINNTSTDEAHYYKHGRFARNQVDLEGAVT
jgi:hypothetical protein